MEKRILNKLRFGIFCSLYLVYVLVGATGFMLIESPLEVDIRNELWTLRRDFKAKAYCITGKRLLTFQRKSKQEEFYCVTSGMTYN
jgi:hypothetical protein